jgi:hypothetical protein
MAPKVAIPELFNEESNIYILKHHEAWDEGVQFFHRSKFIEIIQQNDQVFLNSIKGIEILYYVLALEEAITRILILDVFCWKFAIQKFSFISVKRSIPQQNIRNIRNWAH